MKLDERGYRTYQALILGGLGIYLLTLVGDGRILRYINQRFVLLVVGAAVAFLFLAQVVMKHRPVGKSAETGGGYSRAGLWLVGFPLLIGLLAPQQSLGASAVALRGLHAGVGPAQNVSQGQAALAIPAEERSLLDWMRAFDAVDDLSALDGQRVDVIGFVYRDLSTPAGRFVVTRFSVTCCVADAAAIGLETDWSGASPGENTWVRARGFLRVVEDDGRKRPYLQATALDSLPAPEQPYLFP